MRTANLFILGVQKCGTTSLATHLNSHPDIFVPSVKETYHFCLDSSFARGNDWFEKEFYSPKAAEAATYRVDATPFYLVSEVVLKRIADYCGPEARFMAILRDPVSRAVSAYRHQVRLGHEKLSLNDALDAEPERIARMRDAGDRWWRHAYVAVGKYGEQLERAFDLLGRERILILSQTALQDVAGLNGRISAFLGLSRPLTSLRIPLENQAPMPRSRLIRSLITTQNPIKSLAQSVVPREMRSRIGGAINTRNAKPAKILDVSLGIRMRLAAAFAADRERLARLGIDATGHTISLQDIPA
jgi:hypothetical protein